MLKTLFRISLLAGISLSLLHCTSGKNEGDDPKTLYVALSAGPKTLDPRFTTDANGMRIANLMFSSIVRLGPDLKIIGEAAESWTYANKVFQFQLRPGLKFSDGSPVTAEDIQFSLDQYRSDRNPFHSALKVIEKVEVKYDESERVLKLHLSDFSATLLTDLSPVKILPKKAVLEHGDDFNKVLIGSGPYALTGETVQEIRLKAVPDHPYAPAKIENLIFKIIKDDNTRVQKLLKGDIDIAQAEIPPNKVVQLKSKSKNLTSHEYPGLSMTYLLLNLKNTDLAKKDFRKALASALNIQEIIQYKLEGLATPATSLLTPGNPFVHEGLQPVAYQPEHAKQVIEKLGLAGKEFTLKTSSQASVVENARIIASQLESAGIRVKIQSYEWGTFYNDVQSGNFEMATMRWVGATDPDIYRIAFHSSEKPPGRNRGQYFNTELDRLLDQGVRIENESQRIEHYKKVQEMIFADMPIIPLWYDTQVSFVHERVRGYQPPKNGDFTPFVSVTKSVVQ